MSRHRNMRNMIAEEDYGYDDDDYYDDYDDDYIATAPKTNNKTSGSSKKKKKAAAAAAAATAAAATTNTTSATATTGAAKKSTATQQQPKQQQSTTPKKPSMIITPAKSAVTAATAGAAVSSSSQLEVVRPPSTKATTTLSSSTLGGLTVIAAAKTAPSASSLLAPPPPPGFQKTDPSPPPPPPGFHNNNKTAAATAPIPTIKAGTTATTPATTAATTATAAAASTTMTMTTMAYSASTAPSPPAIPQILLQERNNNQTSSSLPSLTCVVLGHVDAGKSTLTGHLLWKAAAAVAAGGNNNKNTNRGNKNTQQRSQHTQNNNNNNINFAWLLDEDEQERKHGITMDIATKILQTRRYNIIIQDAPGHKDYVPNMITGTANADAAIIVVDVNDLKTLQPLLLTNSSGKKVRDNGFSCSSSSSSTFNIGQLREHLVLAKGLGIPQLIVVINKMDVKQWNEALYCQVKQIVQDFLTRQLGYTNNQKLQFLPASGLTGINILEKPNNDNVPELTSWYNNNNSKKHVPITLFEALDRLELPGVTGKQAAAGGGGGGLLAKPLRIVLTDVGVSGGGDGSNVAAATSNTITSSKRGVSVRGKVVAGWVRVGQSVTLLPSQDVATVQKVSRLVDHEGNNDDNDDDSNNKNSSSSSNNKNERSQYGAAGEVVDMVLMDVDLSRLAVGTLLAPAWSSLPNSMLPMVSNHCRCKIYVLDAVPIPIIRGATASFHMHHLDVPCHVNKLIETLSSPQQQQQQQGDNNNNINNNTSSDVNNNKKKRPPRALTARTTALVEITLLTAIAMESFSDCRPLGRFVLRRGGDSIAVGRIEQVLLPTTVDGSSS